MIRFDTLDKKPKLYDLLIAAIALIVIYAVLIFTLGEGSSVYICSLQAAFAVYILVRLIIAFFRQIRYNPYSYNVIYYFGFALFDVYVSIAHILVLGHMIRMPELYTGRMIIHVLLGSAETFMILSFPLLFVFAVSMCISNISLLRHEGRRFVNVLGVILSVLLVGGALFIFFFDRYASGSMIEVMIHDIFANSFSSIYLYFECMVLGVIVADAIAAKYDPEKDKDFVIILGCSLMKDGTPTPLLRGRVDRAVEFYKKQKEETGKELTFITSGGQGPDEVISESLSMKNYLLSLGIPEERIIEEDKSANTFENMEFSKEKIMAIDPDAKVAFSTTNYHVFRSGLYARRHKMRAQGMGAPTKWYFWPNAAVREFVGLLTAHKLKQAVILGSMVVIHIVLTLVSYLVFQR
ncbi:MAG: YdcF family protein [Firmicutes bacterium]|nr:YdcF family protein [Bacillota bacterium]